uniref:Uncharacterized protein n=1 Tax=Anguilla anguilla TaxID=7936 RepID=A0A0E9UTX2_ANGAN
MLVRIRATLLAGVPFKEKM